MRDELTARPFRFKIKLSGSILKVLMLIIVHFINTFSYAFCVNTCLVCLHVYF